MENHQYSLTELEMMIPWEREIYMAMLIEDMKQKEQMRKEMQGF